MVNLLLVGIGGCVGSVARYLVSTWVQQRLDDTSFPFGTLAVNCLGCFVIGLIFGLAEARGAMRMETRLLLAFGFCGGFTTFSAFGYETLTLLADRQAGAALANVAVQVLLGLGAVWLGMLSARVLGGTA